MKLLAVGVIISFIAVAGFGFAGFSVTHDTAFMTCAGHLMGSACNTNSMAEIHTNIYHNFSLAILAMMIMLVLAGTTPILQTIVDNESKLVPNFEITSVIQPKLLNWLAIHEIRDPSV
jgi:hypothetical protein